MLFCSTSVCCLSFTVTGGKPLQLSGPWSDRAWFTSPRLPIRLNPRIPGVARSESRVWYMSPVEK